MAIKATAQITIKDLTIDDLDVTGRNLILNSRETKVTWQQYKDYTWEEVMV